MNECVQNLGHQQLTFRAFRFFALTLCFCPYACFSSLIRVDEVFFTRKLGGGGRNSTKLLGIFGFLGETFLGKFLSLRNINMYFSSGNIACSAKFYTGD